MRKILVVVACALVAGAVLYQLLAGQQGFVLVSVGSYVLQTSLWTACLLAVALLLALLLLRKVYRALFLPGRWFARRAGQRERKQVNQTMQGFVDYIEGNWPSAIANLKKSVGQSSMPAVNYLGAASASFNMGDRNGAAELLRQAESARLADSFTTDLLRTRLFLQEADFNRALPLAESLQRRNPRHTSALRLLASTRKGLRDWRGLEAMLPDLRKQAVLSTQEMDQLEVEVYREIIAAFADGQRATMARAELQGALDRRWNELPRHLQKNPSLMAEYVRQLVKLGNADKAEPRLRRFLSRHWASELVDIYGSLDCDQATQLTVAEAWLRDNPDDPVLLRTLGRLCAKAELWGKARTYLERSLTLSPNPHTFNELGELLARLNDTAGSAHCYQQGLRAAIGLPPGDLPLPVTRG